MSIFGRGSWYNPAGFFGKAGDLKAYAGTKEGSLMSGRAILQGGPKEQNMESARTFDVFGSPATAGTNQQTTARAGALAYGAAMGAGAMGMGGGTTGAPAGGAAPSAGAPIVDGATSGGMASSGGAAPWWQQFARQSPQQMRQQQQYQPQWQMLDDGTIDPQLLARILREYRG